MILRRSLRKLKKYKQDELPQCDETIQSAWIRFNKLQNNQDFAFRSRVDMTDDQAIMICNLEAKRTNMPYAIKKRFWLTDVWGCLKIEFTDSEIMEALKKPITNNGPVPKYNLSTIS